MKAFITKSKQAIQYCKYFLVTFTCRSWVCHIFNYYSNKRKEASLIGEDKGALLPVGVMTSLINLKKAEH